MKKNTDWVLVVCFLILGCMSVYIAYENYKLRTDNTLYNEALDYYSGQDATIKILDPELRGIVKRAAIVGVAYKTDEMYCIWTEGMTDEQINATLYHENCHILTYRKYDHFCYGDDTNRN
tara:strand:+ start:6017 stop:6376 length:360 start_codon:yes stop_codon:yes gene_type:complete